MLVDLFCADLCIVGTACTQIGGFLGSLLSLYATKLESIAIESRHRTFITAS